jgi:MFS family permease
MVGGISRLSEKQKVAMAIFVSALGYFVDVFDIALFSIVRVASLKDFGLVGDELLQTGAYLINAQMIGMLIGGLFWGVLGDKVGRIQVLFGSILLYSVANIANAVCSL